MLTIQIKRAHLVILAAVLFVPLCLGLAVTGTVVGRALGGGNAASARYTADDVVAAFRSHGLAAVDPRPYTRTSPAFWYDKRPAGSYTIETVVTGTVNSPGLLAGVVWVAADEATANTIAEYVRDLRGRSSEGFLSYQRGNVVLFFWFFAGEGWESTLQRYFVAFGTMP